MKNNIKRFNRWAVKYDKSLLQRFLFGVAQNQVFYAILSAFKKRNGKTLDIACGTGIFSLALKKWLPNVEVHGIDRSPIMIEKANAKKMPWSGVKFPEARFKVGEAYPLPYADNTFDAVTCNTAFHHFPDQLRALKEMYRVTKPGGRVVIVDGDVNRILGWIIYKIFVKIQEQKIYHQYACGMNQLMNDAGLVCVYQTHFNFFIPCLMTVGVKQ